MTFKHPQYLRFQVLTAASVKMDVFCVVAPCNLVEVYRRFRHACCLHHQGDEYSVYQTTRRNNPEDSHLHPQSVFPLKIRYQISRPYKKYIILLYILIFMFGLSFHFYTVVANIRTTALVLFQRRMLFQTSANHSGVKDAWFRTYYC
jgi:hypothetical protein